MPEIYAVINSGGKTIAVAGSGDYRNYFEENGERFSHEIDPRTGRPVKNDLAAVYVIDSSAALADALATAYMIMGLEEARALAESMDQAAYFIYRIGSGEFADHQSKAFNEYLDFWSVIHLIITIGKVLLFLDECGYVLMQNIALNYEK